MTDFYGFLSYDTGCCVICVDAIDRIQEIRQILCGMDYVLKYQVFNRCAFKTFCESCDVSLQVARGVDDDVVVAAIFATEKAISDIVGILEESYSVQFCNEKCSPFIFDAICNHNTVSFLSYANTEIYPKSKRRIHQYLEAINTKGLDVWQFIIDSSTALAVWGLREARDLDYIHLTADDDLVEVKNIDNHATQLRFYSISREELIGNPDYYFTYMGCKFVWLEILGTMKARRGEEKDVRDLDLINRKLSEINPFHKEIRVAGYEWRDRFSTYLIRQIPSIREGRYNVVKDVETEKLLVSQRFDLAAKFLYIDYKEGKLERSFAEEVYGKHIEAFSGGRYLEPGNKDKYSLDQFMEKYNQIIKDIGTEGFDDKISLIPVGTNGAITDGAHRVASALFYNKRVSIAVLEDECVNYDYMYFRRHRLSEELLGYMAIRFIEAIKNDNVFFACLWPRCPKDYKDEIKKRLIEESEVIFDKDIDISKHGLRNLMIQIYEDNPWIGNVSNHFSGAIGKVTTCFAENEVLRCIVFRVDNVEKAKLMKQEYRKMTGLENAALHISDNKNESLRLARLLFHPNSIHALEYGIPDNSIKCDELIHSGEMIMSSEVSLSIYGVRKLNDGCHGQSGADYTLNPRLYFWWYNKKVPSLSYASKHVILTGKERRRVRSLISKDHNSELYRAWGYFVTSLYWIAKGNFLKRIVMVCIYKTGMYNISRELYHRIRGDKL